MVIWSQSISLPRCSSSKGGFRIGRCSSCVYQHIRPVRPPHVFPWLKPLLTDKRNGETRWASYSAIGDTFAIHSTAKRASRPGTSLPPFSVRHQLALDECRPFLPAWILNGRLRGVIREERLKEIVARDLKKKEPARFGDERSLIRKQASF